jgi:hypothetical protein
MAVVTLTSIYGEVVRLGLREWPRPWRDYITPVRQVDCKHSGRTNLGLPSGGVVLACVVWRAVPWHTLPSIPYADALLQSLRQVAQPAMSPPFRSGSTTTDADTSAAAANAIY